MNYDRIEGENKMKKNVLLIVLKLLRVFTPFTMLRSIEDSLEKGEINFSFCVYMVIAICCTFVFYKVVRANLEEDKRMWKPLKEATAFLFAAVSLFIYNKGIFTCIIKAFSLGLRTGNRGIN